MKHILLKIIVCLLICCVLASVLLPVTVMADTGPKPSVRVTFENMGEELCYGTLLSKNSSTGPYSALNEDEEYYYVDENNISEKVRKAFTEYKDSDGYYFLQNTVWQVNEAKSLAWTYYPPSSFKILLYYPETEKFAVSGICERYAFDTYYTVDMSRVEDGLLNSKYDETLSNDSRMEARKSYQWQQETVSLAARILITIAVEMGIALLFGFRGKKTLLFLAAVNVATQIILNVLLNVINFNSGQASFVRGYILLEIVIFVLEAALYATLLKKLSERERTAGYYVAYAFIANAASFGAGMVIAHLIPGIF